MACLRLLIRDWKLLYATSLSYVQTLNAKMQMLKWWPEKFVFCSCFLIGASSGLFHDPLDRCDISCGTLDHGTGSQMYKINWISGVLDLE